MAALMFLGARWKGSVASDTGTAMAKRILLGISVFVPFWELSLVAGKQRPLAVFFVLLLATILLYGWILKRQGWLGTPAFVLFGLGWYLHNVLQAALIISLVAKNPVAGCCDRRGGPAHLAAALSRIASESRG